jgi:YD repeat-containing protein
MLSWYSHLTFAQDEFIELVNFTPPAPAAYELGKFGDIPIGMFTGTANFSVSIMTFGDGKTNIPISVDYSSNGIKVDQLSTKVGLGWNLIAGGVISRIVNQNPDELRGPMLPPEGQDYETLPWLEYFFNLAENSENINVDGVPDVFRFNFLGRTGKFTLNKQKEPVLLDNISLSITYYPDESSGFLIVDEQGIEYYFLTIETTRTDMSDGESSIVGNFAKTSYYLSRIETPQNLIIYFDYEDEDYNYVITQSQNAFIYSNALSNYSYGICAQPALSPEKSRIMNHLLIVQGKRLSKIHSNNTSFGRIEFEYEILHPEVDDYYLLNSIIQKDNAESVIENVSLVYKNVKNRMFLDKVQFLDTDKNYTFDYINIDQLPNRLSKSKDHWGFFNGQGNSTLFPDLAGVSGYGDRFAAIFTDGANRELNEDKAKIGLLKKITYPVKGYSQIEYGSHDYNVLEEITVKKSFFKDVYSVASNVVGASAEETIEDIIEDELVPFQAYCSVNYQSCSLEPHPDEADRYMAIIIENLDESQDNIIQVKTYLGYSSKGNSITIREGDDSEYAFDFKANYRYKITLQVYYPCLMGTLSFRYKSEPSYYEYVNKKTGGLRVENVTDYNYSGDELSSQQYYYASKDDLEISSGRPGLDPYYFSNFYLSGSCQIDDQYFCAPWLMKYIRLNSGSMNAMYRTEVQNTRYSHVSVSQGTDDFLNGGIEYQYMLSSGFSQVGLIFGEYPNFQIIGQRDWGDGLLNYMTVFKKVGTELKKVATENYDYVRDPRVNDIVEGYVTSKKYDGTCVAYPSPDVEDQLFQDAEAELNASKVYLTANWYYLASKIDESYDLDGNLISTNKIDYSYDNPLHAKLSNAQFTDSEKNIIVQSTVYPQDIEETARTVAESSLVTQHRIATPIDLKTTKIEGGTKKIVKRKYNKYSDWGSGIVEIETIRTLLGNDLEDRVVYHNYDGKGNPLQVSKPNGVNYCYIWGYGQAFPVAKIENAQYTSISSDLISSIQLKSDSDNDRCLAGEGCKEDLLRIELDKLRLDANLSGSLITTYTYDPLVGMTSQTDPGGVTMYYEYDDFGRLREIKDEERKILKLYEYKYGSEGTAVSTDPEWTDTGNVRCVVDGNGDNTGEAEKEQMDTNENSSSYNMRRWVSIGEDLTTCPVPEEVTINLELINLTSGHFKIETEGGEVEEDLGIGDNIKGLSVTYRGSLTFILTNYELALVPSFKYTIAVGSDIKESREVEDEEGVITESLMFEEADQVTITIEDL